MPSAFITGGSRGIGRAIAERFASSGYDVLTPTRRELDLSSPEAVAHYASRPEVRAADVLVNCAGINRPVPLPQTELSELRDHLAINVEASFLFVRAIGAAMAERGRGHIVNVSSVYGSVSRPGRAMYSTTKAALDGLTRAAAVEFGPSNVLVNSICPGFVDTDLTRQNNTPEQIAVLCATVPLRRLASVDEIADFAYYLGSEKNTYISGQTIPIDGGFLCQ
jgi:3-oxoacyl-[acyl-carrier protein] reductase